jgi:hypothetical protein
VSGGDQEGVALKAPVLVVTGWAFTVEASLWGKAASEPGSSQVPGMGLAVARIASQVVPGVEVARAWSAASAWNGGGLARIRLPPGGGGERDARKRQVAQGAKPLPGWHPAGS